MKHKSSKKILLKIKVVLTVFFTITISSASCYDKKPFTLEDIFQKSLFYQQTVRGINWMANGRYYTSQVHDDTSYYEHILKYDITTGNVVDTLVNGAYLVPEDEPYALAFSDYALSPDETKVLLATEVEPIYRRSSKAYYYVYDLISGDFNELASGNKQSYASFSPDGSRVAFVRNNNLFIVNLDDMSVKQVTQDGEKNQLIHGSTDWVYEEEFGFAKAFFWSPEGDKLAFMSFDESAVKEYNMQVWGDLYPQDYRFKYPKAGEDNSVVRVSVYHVNTDKTMSMDTGNATDIYIPRVQWTTDNNLLSIIRMNRLQNKMEILHADAATGQASVIITEESDTYVDIEFNDDLVYLQDGQRFIRTSEKDGFKHIYLYHMNGSQLRQITRGNWEVSELLGIDEKENLLYYISTEASPLERHLYHIDIKGKRKKQLSHGKGTYDADFSPDFRYFILYHSDTHNPLNVSLHSAPSGRLVKILEDNQELKEELNGYTLGTKEFFTFETSDQKQLYGYTIKPADFDSTRQYPVLMYVYGGPGSQQVADRWMGERETWHHYLTQKGYIVACIDNRGTGARGRDFRHATYAHLGKYEVQDQIAGAEHLAGLPYVDQDRIGIWGWSYGGYMSLLSLFIGHDIFRTAIAVAPVTNWRFYDTIYTERYLQTPQLNPQGYDQYSPLTHADKLEGDLLLIHGTGDDNVHFQNSVELEDALIAANKQFRSFFYPNRNHGIYGGNTRFHLYQMMTSFIVEKL